MWRITPIAQKWWCGFHRRWQHVIQTIFKETEDNNNKMTEDGDEKITENSDY